MVKLQEGVTLIATTASRLLESLILIFAHNNMVATFYLTALQLTCRFCLDTIIMLAVDKGMDISTCGFTMYVLQELSRCRMK